MIPTYEQFMIPVLQVLSDGEELKSKETLLLQQLDQNYFATEEDL